MTNNEALIYRLEKASWPDQSGYVGPLSDLLKDAAVALRSASVSATPQQVQEACARAAVRAVESDEASATKYTDVREKFEQRAYRGKTIAISIRALILPEAVSARDAVIEAQRK